MTTDVWLPNSQAIFSPYTTTKYVGLNPACDVGSPGGCIIASWEGGNTQLTGTAGGEGEELAVRNLDFQPDAGHVEPSDGPPLGTDPGEWTGTLICILPPRVEQQQTGDRILVDIYNGADVLVRTLAYTDGERLDIVIRCEEEGPP